MSKIEKLIVKKTVKAKKSYHQCVMSHTNAHREHYLATRFEALFGLIVELGLVNEYIDQL